MLKSIVIRNSWQGAVYADSGAHHLTFDGDQFLGSGQMNASREATQGWPAALSLNEVNTALVTNTEVNRTFGEGIGLPHATNVRVTQSRIVDSYSVGVYCDNCGDTVIEKNFIGSTGSSGLYRNGEPATCVGIAREVASQTMLLTNVTVRNNVMVRCRDGLEFGTWLGNGRVQNLLFANNVVNGAARSMVKFDYHAQSANNRIVNNVFYQNLTGSMVLIEAGSPAPQFDHNTWHGGSVTAAATGAGDVYSDPLFADPLGFDPLSYKLRSGSPSAGRGTTLSAVPDDLLGVQRTAPYDMGAFATGFVPPPMNLVVNPGFETGTLAPWTTYGTAAIGTVPHTGDRSATITTAAGAEGGVEQVISNLKPNTVYTLRAWARVSAPGEAVYIGVKNYGGSQYTATISDTVWAAGSVTFPTGATSTQATIFLYKPSGQSPAYGDDFEIVEGSNSP